MLLGYAFVLIAIPLQRIYVNISINNLKQGDLLYKPESIAFSTDLHSRCKSVYLNALTKPLPQDTYQ